MLDDSFRCPKFITIRLRSWKPLLSRPDMMRRNVDAQQRLIIAQFKVSV